MSWITPLGFLGLLGIVALIVIYLLKPNYQTKMVSSTYVWKLSLKYKKKRIPISLLRSLLLLLCQILIITACSMLLAQPVIKGETVENVPETIAVIDASASMRASDNGETRFQRAVSQVETLAAEIAAENGRISIILAGQKAEFIAQRSGSDMLQDTLDALAAAECSYVSGDIDGAMDLAQEVLDVNPNAQVNLYTGTTYYDSGIVNVVDVSGEEDWNVAIVDAGARTEENYYVFDLEVGCYGRSESVEIECFIYGVNGGGDTYRFTVTNDDYASDPALDDPLLFREDGTSSVTIDPKTYKLDPIYSYSYAYFVVNENDSLSLDNSFYLYGGTKTTVRIQYYSSKPNSFFTSFLLVLRDSVSDNWDIELSLITQTGAEYETEGFDFYIFEHTMPNEMPTDGVVLLFDPDKMPSGMDITLGNYITDSGDDGNGVHLTAGVEHAVTQYVDIEGIQVYRYKPIRDYESSDAYVPLMYVGDTPVMLLKNTSDEKVVVCSFDLNYSTLPMLEQFPLLMYNLFEYYFPVTTSDSSGSGSYLYDAGDTVSLNARGSELIMTAPSEYSVNRIYYTEFPASVELTVPGVYTFEQLTLSGEKITENVYVKLAATESNIFFEVDELNAPYVEEIVEEEDKDLMIWFAIAMVALLFLEWWLQARENF